MKEPWHPPIELTLSSGWQPYDDKEVRMDIFKCENCGCIAHIKNCHTHRECESWEMPTPYTVVDCPHCPETEGMMEPHAESMSRLAIAWHNFQTKFERFIERL